MAVSKRGWWPGKADRRQREVRDLSFLVATSQEIAASLDRAALAKLLDPAEYLGLSGEMVDRVLERLASTESRN